jgi:hypothetical protein
MGSCDVCLVPSSLKILVWNQSAMLHRQTTNMVNFGSNLLFRGHFVQVTPKVSQLIAVE